LMKSMADIFPMQEKELARIIFLLQHGGKRKKKKGGREKAASRRHRLTRDQWGMLGKRPFECRRKCTALCKMEKKAGGSDVLLRGKPAGAP